jgi:hypothetical protein
MKHMSVAAALVLLSLLFAALALAPRGLSQEATQTEPVIRAQLIELVDSSGTIRAQLATEESGEVVFRLRDREGNIRVKLGADHSGSGLLLADDRSEVGVHILSGTNSLTGEHSTMITVSDPDGARTVIRPSSGG